MGTLAFHFVVTYFLGGGNSQCSPKTFVNKCLVAEGVCVFQGYRRVFILMMQ